MVVILDLLETAQQLLQLACLNQKVQESYKEDVDYKDSKF